MRGTDKHETRLQQVARDALPSVGLALVVAVGCALMGLADPIGYGLLTLAVGLLTTPMLQAPPRRMALARVRPRRPR